MCGTLARISCLSFNGNKIVTTGGGGAIMTDDDEIARQARYLTTQAKEDGLEYIHNSVGYNYRMNNVLAAIGLAQLETLDERLETKRANFARYQEGLGQGPPPRPARWSELNRWFYALLCDSADMKRELHGRPAWRPDVQVRPLWHLNHLQKPYREMQAHRIDACPPLLRHGAQPAVLGLADAAADRGGGRPRGGGGSAPTGDAGVGQGRRDGSAPRS